MKAVAFILNLPWTIIMLFLACISLPRSLYVRDAAVIITVASLWWRYTKGVRAMTLGNVVIIGPLVESNDLEHELIHIEQHMKHPFIQPFLSAFEQARHGSYYSKYEQEAYRRAGNSYHGYISSKQR